MVRIVGVHGLGQQLKGRHTLKDVWLPAMRDGFERANAPIPADWDLTCAFYGDLFRTKGLGDPPYTPRDVAPGFEQELLMALVAPGGGDRAGGART